LAYGFSYHYFSVSELNGVVNDDDLIAYIVTMVEEDSDEMEAVWIEFLVIYLFLNEGVIIFVKTPQTILNLSATTLLDKGIIKISSNDKKFQARQIRVSGD
jgi:hypothetical protein